VPLFLSGNALLCNQFVANKIFLGNVNYFLICLYFGSKIRLTGGIKKLHLRQLLAAVELLFYC